MHLPDEVREQRGLFTYQQARAAGITHHRLYAAVDAGVLARPEHGVFGPVAAPTDEVAAHATAVLQRQLSSSKPWAAARRSALFLMGVPLLGRGAPPRPLLQRDGSERKPHARDRFERIGPFPPEHRWTYGGILMATPARACVDLARAERFGSAVVAMDGALRRGMPAEDVHDVLHVMRRWPGVSGARAAFAFADGRSESALESLTRVACLLHRLPVPEPQVELWRDGRFVARLYLLVRSALLALEPDGAVKFTDAGVLPALLERHEEIKDCGVEVQRVPWNQVVGDSSAFAERMRSRLAERGRRVLPRGVELRSTPVWPQQPLLGWSEAA